MANLTLRAAKGSALTHAEVDGNFTALNDGLPVFHASEYGVVPGAADNTAEIQAVIDAAYAATAGTLGGATVVFPPGLFNLTSVSRTFANSRTVKIQGAGRLATVFQKIGATTTPVFDFSSGVTNTPQQGADFADFTILGNAKANPGIRLTMMSNFTLNRVSIFACSTALDLIGSLIFACHDCVLTGNNYGIVTRKYPVAEFAGGGVFCNSWSFNGGTIQTNTSWGVDIGDADGVYFQGTNFERNGNSDNLGTDTGAVIIRATVDDESVYSIVDFNEIWFELNYCRMVEVEAAVGLGLTFRDCHTDGSASGNSTINVAGIRQLNIINFPMLRSLNAVVSAATRTLIVGQRPFNYTDNSVTTIVGESIRTQSISANGAISDTGQVGTFAFLSASSGLANVGAYNFDAVKMEPLNLFASHVQFPLYTDAQLNDVDHVVNTDPGKTEGAMVFNSTQNKPVYAINGSDAGQWVDGAGVTTNTPV